MIPRHPHTQLKNEVEGYFTQQVTNLLPRLLRGMSPVLHTLGSYVHVALIQNSNDFLYKVNVEM